MPNYISDLSTGHIYDIDKLNKTPQGREFLQKLKGRNAYLKSDEYRQDMELMQKERAEADRKEKLAAKKAQKEEEERKQKAEEEKKEEERKIAEYEAGGDGRRREAISELKGIFQELGDSLNPDKFYFAKLNAQKYQKCEPEDADFLIFVPEKEELQKGTKDANIKKSGLTVEEYPSSKNFPRPGNPKILYKDASANTYYKYTPEETTSMGYIADTKKVYELYDQGIIKQLAKNFNSREDFPKEGDPQTAYRAKDSDVWYYWGEKTSSKAGYRKQNIIRLGVLDLSDVRSVQLVVERDEEDEPTGKYTLSCQTGIAGQNKVAFDFTTSEYDPEAAKKRNNEIENSTWEDRVEKVEKGEIRWAKNIKKKIEDKIKDARSLYKFPEDLISIEPTRKFNYITQEYEQVPDRLDLVINKDTEPERINLSAIFDINIHTRKADGNIVPLVLDASLRTETHSDTTWNKSYYLGEVRREIISNLNPQAHRGGNVNKTFTKQEPDKWTQIINVKDLDTLKAWAPEGYPLPERKEGMTDEQYEELVYQAKEIFDKTLEHDREKCGNPNARVLYRTEDGKGYIYIEGRGYSYEPKDKESKNNYGYKYTWIDPNRKEQYLLGRSNMQQASDELIRKSGKKVALKVGAPRGNAFWNKNITNYCDSLAKWGDKTVSMVLARELSRDGLELTPSSKNALKKLWKAGQDPSNENAEVINKFFTKVPENIYKDIIKDTTKDSLESWKKEPIMDNNKMKEALDSKFTQLANKLLNEEPSKKDILDFAVIVRDTDFDKVEKADAELLSKLADKYSDDPRFAKLLDYILDKASAAIMNMDEKSNTRLHGHSRMLESDEVALENEDEDEEIALDNEDEDEEPEAVEDDPFIILCNKINASDKPSKKDILELGKLAGEIGLEKLSSDQLAAMMELFEGEHWDNPDLQSLRVHVLNWIEKSMM